MLRSSQASEHTKTTQLQKEQDILNSQKETLEEEWMIFSEKETLEAELDLFGRNYL